MWRQLGREGVVVARQTISKPKVPLKSSDQRMYLDVFWGASADQLGDWVADLARAHAHLTGGQALDHSHTSTLASA